MEGLDAVVIFKGLACLGEVHIAHIRRYQLSLMEKHLLGGGGECFVGEGV